MFDLMWTLGSQRVWGQCVAIRAASHERTSNICGPESMQNSHTQGQKRTSPDSFARLSNAKTFYCVGRSDRGFCQAFRIKDEVTCGSVQEWSKLAGMKNNKQKQPQVFSILKRNAIPGKSLMKHRRRLHFFFLYSPFFFPPFSTVLFSSQVKEQLVSWLLKREILERDWGSAIVSRRKHVQQVLLGC